eukprot:TRINITY_DN11650_c0_g1_i1.p1 TRINITY_DN11650_c0_g1~~TRINITY_DN11650_c0_g1_i1.p1  ORF type:complete len:207 (-),score=27.59 TRINITY_DN11650_c0_g1_i1:517-1137(-)
MNMISLYGKSIRVNKAISFRDQTRDVGANLFIGNLDPAVDEKILYDTFAAFGGIIPSPKIMRDPDSNDSRGFGFLSFDSFEASDAAIEAMNGQYLMNKPITVSYAIKKDTKTGERHGTVAERMLAAKNPARKTRRPHTVFGTGQAMNPAMNPAMRQMGVPFPMGQNMFGMQPMMPGMPMMRGMMPGQPMMPMPFNPTAYGNMQNMS